MTGVRPALSRLKQKVVNIDKLQSGMSILGYSDNHNGEFYDT